VIPITPRTFQHLSDWCEQYQKNSTTDVKTRFSIGIYQISQGMAYHIDSPCRWQSFCAAAMHFIMAGHEFGYTLDSFCFDVNYNPENWRQLLWNIGRCQQQIVYHNNGIGSRASRFNATLFQDLLNDLVKECFMNVPNHYHEQGCFDEMHILTGDIK
jgi:hypothetical protein